MLVSCVLPTFDRPQFLPAALRSFLSQDYSERELIVVDVGHNSIRHLIPEDPHIKYVRSDTPLPCGTARNLGTQHASGEIVLNFDDDDWYSHDRVSRQVAFHLESGRAVTGYSYIVMHDLNTGAFNRYTMAAPYSCGPTITYTRSYWVNNRIDDINEGEDWRYVKRAADQNESARNEDDSRITVVARTHSRNTVSREPLYATPQWIVEPPPPGYFAPNKYY